MRLEKLIFDQAERTPEAVAIEHNGDRLSYRQLKAQALETSRELRRLGLAPGQTVVICQHRSLATLPLMLAIWEAGGIVVPINPTTPAKILECMIEDCSPRIILTDASFESAVADAVNNLNLISPPAIVAGDPHSNGHLELNHDGSFNQTIDEDTCYVIYTSGSEGRPKGVVGSHKSLVHYLQWQVEEFSVNETDRFSQTAPLSFDFSLKELLVPLLCGARVCIADRSIVMDARKFLEWVQERGITVMCCVPTLLRSILQLPDSESDATVFQSLRALLISGDMLRWEDVSGWRDRFGNSISLFNLYGPTESTVIKLFYPIPKTRLEESINVPVGRPIRDADVLVLDELDEACEPGEIGEIVILSEWLAQGYLNAEQTHDQRFCSLNHDGRQRRAYRTGDLGRWHIDGNLELMGRKDRQVKIRGYRIELDEIESILAEHEAVRDVSVVVLNPSNNIDVDGLATIACYFTTEQPALSKKEIRDFAKERLLPQVLSLTRFRCLDKLPLTANGKVDRIKLQSLIDPHENNGRQSSSNALLTVRERIVAMWEELLALEGIDVEANFFELGGDSMTAIRLLRRLREELHAEIKLGDVYEYPSVSQLTNRVEQLLA